MKDLLTRTPGAASQQLSPDTRQTRSARLRAMLESPGLEFLLEAHNGLSARLVREAGFKGIDRKSVV